MHKADSAVVNCVEPHPFLAALATFSPSYPAIARTAYRYGKPQTVEASSIE